jgi:hypothetical protein
LIALVILILNIVSSQSAKSQPPGPPPAGDDRSTRLIKAIEDDQIEVAAALLDDLRAAAPPLPLPTLEQGGTLLHRAAEKSHPEMIRMLLERGMNIEATDALGRTPLHRAHSLTARALIDAGANWLALDSLGNSPLHYAAEQAGSFCQLFVEKGMPVDARNNAGLSPLHFAVLYGEKTSLEYLLDRGADVNAKTLAPYDYLPWWFDPESNRPQRVDAGRTPLDIARMLHRENKWSSGRHRAIVEMLEGRGGVASVSRQPFTPSRLVFLLISIASLVVMLWGLLLLDGRITGWHALAGRYAAPVTPADVRTNQDGGVGRIGLLRIKSLYRAAATDDGLYLAVPGLLRAGHPPLLIPWTDLTIVSDKTMLGIEVLELRAPDADGELIVLRGGIAPEVRQRLTP